MVAGDLIAGHTIVFPRCVTPRARTYVLIKSRFCFSLLCLIFIYISVFWQVLNRRRQVIWTNLGANSMWILAGDANQLFFYTVAISYIQFFIITSVEGPEAFHDSHVVCIPVVQLARDDSQDPKRDSLAECAYLIFKNQFSRLVQVRQNRSLASVWNTETDLH